MQGEFQRKTKDFDDLKSNLMKKINEENDNYRKQGQ